MEVKKLEERVRKKSIKNLGHAGGSVRKAIKEKITRSRFASKPGQPVHTRKGQAKRGVLYGVSKNKLSVVIGFARSRMGKSMQPQEHGGKYKGGTYPKRPTVLPAFQEVLPRLPRHWHGTIR